MSNGGLAAQPKALRLLELAAPSLAIFGLTASMLPDYLQMSRLGYPGVDFKVVYVSTWLFDHGQDPYNLALAPAVYQAQGLAAPATMFGHAPVYPAFTYALLGPLALLRGSAAVWCALLLSALLMSLAVAALARFAQEQLQLSLPWRLALMACCAACPLLAFALQIGNLSVATAALSILALLAVNATPRRAAVALALAFCLKPHLAVWFLIAVAMSFGARGRKTAALTCGWIALAVLITVSWLFGHALLHTTVRSFVALLQAEQGSGSMSAASREVLPLGAQITSFVTIPELWGAPAAATRALWLLLTLACAGLLGRKAWKSRGYIADPAERLVYAAALLAFGLTVTYHRAHDAIGLLILLPVVLQRLRTSPRRAWVWVAAGALLCLCIPWGTPTPTGSTGWQTLVLLRQAALASLALTAALVLREAKKGGTNGSLSVPGGQ